MKKKIITGFVAMLIFLSCIGNSFATAETLPSFNCFLADHIINKNLCLYDYYKNEYSGIYRAYVEDGKKNPIFQGALLTWELGTFQLSDITEASYKRVGFYETILYDIMYQGSMSEPITDTYEDIVSAVEAGTINDLTDNVTELLKTPFDDLTSRQKSTIAANLQDASELSDIFGAIGTVEKVLGYVNTYEELVHKLAKAEAIVDRVKANKTTLQNMQQCTTNWALKKAIDDMLLICDEQLSWEQIKLYFASESTLRELNKTMLDLTWDLVIENLNVYGLAISIGQAGGQLISNALFATEENLELYYSLNALYECEDAMKAALDIAERNFINNPTDDNAVIFNEAYKLLLQIHTLGFQGARDVLEFENEGSFVNSMITLITKKTDYLETIEILDDLEARMDSHISLSYSAIYNSYSVYTQVYEFEEDEDVSYVITFDSNCSDTSDYQYTYYPSRDNWYVPTLYRNKYVLTGWYLDRACTQKLTSSFTSTIDGDITLYAKWVDRYHNITFDYNCADLTNYTYRYDALYDNCYIPPTPSRSGYVFDGWYLDSACTQEASPLLDTYETNRDLTFYAKWHLQFPYSVQDGNATITGFSPYQLETDSINTNLVIPTSIDGYRVTAIADSVFYNNDNLTTIAIPGSITNIPTGAFAICNRLTSVELGTGVTSIGEGAFSNCDSLASITIPDSVTIIYGSAFYDCDALTSVKLGNGVATVGNYVFTSCDSLTTVDLGNAIKTIGSYWFEDCDALTSITIPDSVTSIGQYAFSKCYSLNDVKLGNGITYVGDYIFSNCHSLTSISIPDSVTSIQLGAFHDCDSLASITIPDSVTNIGHGVFSWCDALTDVKLGNGITSIGDDAFYNCDALTSITIPDSVTSIGQDAFAHCNSLTTVELGTGITSIDKSSFRTCPVLENIYWNAKNVSGFSLGDSQRFPNAKVVIFGDSVETIPEYAFYDCDALTDVKLGNGITNIGDYAFGNCDALTSITIPDSFTSIGRSMFDDCDALTDVNLGNGITSIGDDAFYNCDALTSITIPDSVTSIGQYVFASCSSLTSVTIPDSVTNIGHSVFAWCDALTDVKLGNGITSIGYAAFWHCDALTSITIPDSVTSIDQNAFGSCVSLTTVELGNGITSIGYAAFGNCGSLSDVYYDGSITDGASILIEGNNSSLTDATWHYVIPTEVTVSTVNGAQIRTNGAQGLRFISSIDKTVDFDRVVEYGTVLIPTADITDISQLTIGATFNGHTVAKVKANYIYDEDDETVTFTAVITNIAAKNYAREYTARAYAILDDGSVVYADTGASRSIYSVAKRGLENPNGSDANKALFQSIVDTVEGGNEG